MTAIVAFLACASGDVVPEPRELVFGTVDFQADACPECLCDEGCNPVDLVLTNVGEEPASVRMPQGFDDTHLCLAGYDPVSPLELGLVGPQERLILPFSVCGYAPGELTTTVEGTLLFETDGVDPWVEVPWSVTPIRDQGTTSGA